MVTWLLPLQLSTRLKTLGTGQGGCPPPHQTMTFNKWKFQTCEQKCVFYFSAKTGQKVIKSTRKADGWHIRTKKHFKRSYFLSVGYPFWPLYFYFISLCFLLPTLQNDSMIKKSAKKENKWSKKKTVCFLKSALYFLSARQTQKWYYFQGTRKWQKMGNKNSIFFSASLKTKHDEQKTDSGCTVTKKILDTLLQKTNFFI